MYVKRKGIQTRIVDKIWTRGELNTIRKNSKHVRVQKCIRISHVGWGWHITIQRYFFFFFRRIGSIPCMYIFSFLASLFTHFHFVSFFSHDGVQAKVEGSFHKDTRRILQDGVSGFWERPWREIFADRQIFTPPTKLMCLYILPFRSFIYFRLSKF